MIPALAQALNSRMAMMQDVAAYKAEHHLPIEDLPQEAKVLAKAQTNAQQAGLQPQSVGPFIQAQMDVSKAMQYRYRADWLLKPNTLPQPKPLPAVRAAILDTDKSILSLISQQLTSGGFGTAQQNELRAQLHAANIQPTEMGILVEALSAIKHQNSR